ncbi:MAG: ribbon-helix-helix domain-containing protein [Promethearchaeia archaeon]
MNNLKYTRITVSMPENMLDQLDEICLFKNLNRSEWVRRKIEEDHKYVTDLIER